MNVFYRMLIHLTIGIMIIGTGTVVMAAPIPKGNSFMNSNEEGFDTLQSGSHRYSSDSSGGGCRNRHTRDVEGYSMALNEFDEAPCSSFMDGGTRWMYAPGCTNLGVRGNRIQTGQCSDEEQLLPYLGNLMVRSSDQGLGRVDVYEQISESKKSLSSFISVDGQEANSLNGFRSPIRMNHSVMANAVRFDRLGQGLFNVDEANKVNLAADFDHQLVMSGKLAHLVPKVENGLRELELEDLVFLLLFAILPEKKHIKHFFRGIRRFQIF